MAANSHGSTPTSSAFAITPSDTVDLDVAVRGIYVGAGGNLRVLLEDDTSPVTLVGVITGVIYPLRVRRVYSSSTTASSLIGLT